MSTFTRLVLFLGCLAPLVRAADAPNPPPSAAAEPPTEWIDADTGHRVVRLSREPGTASLYFHQNAYSADGKKLVVTTPHGIATINLANRALDLVVAAERTEDPAQRVNVLVTGRKSGDIYYTRNKVVYATNLDTHATREIARLPADVNGTNITVNADESLLVGIGVDTAGKAEPRTLPNPGGEGRLEARWVQGLPMVMFTINVASGEIRKIYREHDWANHLQCSPTDPTLIMFCHEGPWHLNDRTWLIRTDGTGLTKVHPRTIDGEIAGHEFFSADGQTVWYDLQTPRSEVFWLAGYEIATGVRTWYHHERREWSVHYNVSPDGKLFAGDGGGPASVAAPDNGQWIYLFRPELSRFHALPEQSTGLIKAGRFHAERLVNLAKHDYHLEPNVTFTPDQKWIVFRSNLSGATHVYAVEIAKADPAPPAAAPLAPAEPVAVATLDPKLPTLWIAGDSTAANGGPAATGWGVPFPAYFDPAKINIVNAARGGRSSRTFITEGLWDQILAKLKPGDFVLIQFGHNDAGALNAEPPGSTRPLRARGSIPTLGEETEEIDNVLTKKHETVHTYGWYLRKMVADVKAHGATPVILSLTVRNEWKDGRVERVNGPWRRFSAEIAQTAGVGYVDLTRLIADDYQLRGAEAVKAYFPKDHTHTGPEGAENNAALVVAGLKGLRNGPFKDIFSAKGAAIETDRIGWLNLPEPVDPKLPSLVLIGDSTVRNGRGDGSDGQWGWGEPLAQFFDPARINVVNRAVGGLSSRTFLTQGHWNRALTLLKSGDFLLIQFGHNDSSPVNDTSRARGTLKGFGEETEEIDNLLTRQHETVHTYGWYLRKFIREAKAAGVVPIVCSPVPRQTWQDGKIVRSGDSYAGWAKQVATEEGAGFIDLNERIAGRYDGLGQEKVATLFADKNTHTSAAGAKVNAEIVVEGLHGLPGAPADAFLSEPGRQVAGSK